MMKKYSILITLTLMFVFSVGSCSDFPVDEDGLLITERSDCYVGNFELFDTDHLNIITGVAKIDTIEQIIIAYTRFGAPIHSLWPRFSLSEDSKLDPKVTSWTDFTASKLNIEFVDGDWSAGAAQDQLHDRIIANRSSFPSGALKYTVISGNRKVKKEYTILIVERPMQ